MLPKKTIKKTIGKIYHGPSDWLVNNTTARDRRSFGFWTVIFAITGTALCLAFGVSGLIWFFWLAILSVVALIPNMTAETPVEHED